MEGTALDPAITEFTNLRPIQEEELEETHCLIDLEGWNLTLSKFEQIKELFGSRSIYVAANSEGKIVGTLSVIPTHQGEYVLGNVVVASKHRGKGLGRRMLREIQKIYAGQIITVVSVADALGFYSNCGFQNVGPVHEVIIMEVKTMDVENQLCQCEEIIIKTYTSDMFKDLSQYDSNLRGYNMSKYLSVMVKASQLFVAHSKTSGNITGYMVALQKKSTVIVDGCYADNDNVALHLFWNVLKAYPERDNVKLQTIKPRMFLTTTGKIMPTQSTNYTRVAIGIPLPTSLQNLYAVTDCDYSA